MIQISMQRVKNYVKFLRTKLLDQGCTRFYIKSLSDNDVLEDFRKCGDCGDELFSKAQQMHTILEFDSPERAFEALYEDLSESNCAGETAIQEEECDCEDCQPVLEHDAEECDCEDCQPVLEHDAEDCEECTSNEEIIRGKWLLEGIETLDEAIESLENFTGYLKHLKNEGYKLLSPVENDYGCLTKDE